MIYQYEGKDTTVFFTRVSRRIYDADQWVVIEEKTERVQLRIYVQGVRMAAAAFQLVVTKTRNTPYLTVAGLKYPHLSVELESQSAIKPIAFNSAMAPGPLMFCL